MAIKERNDSPCKPIGEGFFSAVFFPYSSLLRLPSSGSCDLAHWLWLQLDGSLKASIEVTTLAQIEELGNHVINCTQISLMSSYVVMSAQLGSQKHLFDPPGLAVSQCILGSNLVTVFSWPAFCRLYRGECQSSWYWRCVKWAGGLFYCHAGLLLQDVQI